MSAGLWFNREFLGFELELEEDGCYLCEYPASLLPLPKQGVPSEARCVGAWGVEAWGVGAWEEGCPVWKEKESST